MTSEDDDESQIVSRRGRKQGLKIVFRRRWKVVKTKKSNMLLNIKFKSMWYVIIKEAEVKKIYVTKLAHCPNTRSKHLKLHNI